MCALSLWVLVGRGAVGFPYPSHLGSPSTHCKVGTYRKPVTNKHKACAGEATYTVVCVLKKWGCAPVNIWWVMMKWMCTRRGFSEAEIQPVWYQCVRATVLPKRIGVLRCPRVTVFLTDLLLEGTTEEEMKTLLSPEPYKKSCNILFHMFVWKI